MFEREIEESKIKEQEIGFTASLLNDRGEAIGIVQTYYWKTSASQEDVRNMSARSVEDYDKRMYEDILLQFNKIDDVFGKDKIKEWIGTSKKIQNGLIALISEYVRSDSLSNGHFNVRILRIYCGEQSVSFVASYHQEQQLPLRPLLNKVISTFRYQGCDVS